MSFVENLFVVSFNNLVSFEIRSVSDLILISSFPIFRNYSHVFLTASILHIFFQSFQVVFQIFDQIE